MLRSNLHFESQKHVFCNAYYRPLLSNFLKISRSSNDEKHKGMQKEGDVEVEVDEVDEVDEKQ